MTVSTTTSSIIYSGNGVTTSFTFPFIGVASSDIIVYLIDTATDIRTTLVPVQYTLVLNAATAGSLWGIGGLVTYPISGTPVPTGTTITIERAVPYTQDVSISNQGAFYPQTVERGLDLLELQIQQIENSISDLTATTVNITEGLATVGTLVDLRLISATNAATIGTIFLTGFYSKDDGGQGFWTWDSTSSATDNIGTVVNPTGNVSPGRWRRQFIGPLVDLWFGVKADGATDNATALQNVENAANSLGLPIYYPKQSNSRYTSVRITTYAGVIHYGDGCNYLTFTEGMTSNVPGSVIFSGVATSVFLFQTSTGTYTSMPGPQFRDMNIHNTGTGGAIVFNSNAGGFTDDLTSQASADHYCIKRCGFYLNNNTAAGAVVLYKSSNGDVSDCTFSGGVVNLYGKGSDNFEITGNIFENSSTHAIQLENAGTTFGNMGWIQNNVFSSQNASGTDCIYSTYRSTYVQGNFFEPIVTLTKSLINLGNGGINATVTNNEYSVMGSTPATLSVTGSMANLTISGNKNAAGTIVGMDFNSGSGMKAYYNSAVQATITGDVDASNGSSLLPFVTQQNAILGLRQQPVFAGQTYWQFNPSISSLDGSAGSYYQSVMVRPGGIYDLPAIAGTGSQIGWTAPIYNITDTVDVWVLGYASVATQTLSLVFGGVTYTQAISNAGILWYKVVSAAAVVNASTLKVFNADTGHGGHVYIVQVAVVKS